MLHNKLIFPVLKSPEAALVQNQRDWQRNQQEMPVKQLLSNVWDELHQLQQNQLPSGVKTSRPSICLKSGMCVCSGSGAHAKLMHNKLVALTKPRLVTRVTKAMREAAKKSGTKPKKKKTHARLFMEASMLCLKLAAKEPPVLRWGADGWPVIDEDLGDDAVRPPDQWLHVNYMNFREMELHV